MSRPKYFIERRPMYKVMAQAVGMTSEQEKSWIAWYLRGWKKYGPGDYPMGCDPEESEVCSYRLDEFSRVSGMFRK